MIGFSKLTRGGSMIKKEMIAMLLAGGQGSRLGVLTSNMAKPAVAFGGKYRIIDFPLSNCINSGIDTVGVLTQYQPLRLNTHIGIGIPWDLDRNRGGVTVLRRMKRVQAVSGTQEPLMRYIRISNTWSFTIRIMYSFFQVIIYIRWIMSLCLTIIRLIMPM